VSGERVYEDIMGNLLWSGEEKNADTNFCAEMTALNYTRD